MTITTKTKTETREVKVTEIISIVCDVCGEEKKRQHPGATPDYDGGIKWGAESSYSIDTITIARKTGDNFPEGGRSVVESFVVCPDCWGAVKAFFKTGPTTVETDY